MTIQQWSIVLNAIIGVLVVGYGIWLKHVIDQQLRSKDAALEALEAALKTKDAEISRLRADTAPAIADNYAKIRAYAEHLAGEVNRLHQKLETKVPEQDRLIIEAMIQLDSVGRLLSLIRSTPQEADEAFRVAVLKFASETLEEAREKDKRGFAGNDQGAH